MLQNKCSFARTSYATNMFPFTKRKACCENNTAYIRYGNYWKKDTILNRLLSTSSWKNFTFLKTTWPPKGFLTWGKGGGGRRKSTCSRNTKNLEKTTRKQKNIEKTKKNNKTKKTKKNINSRLFRKLGCFTKTPWQLVFLIFLFFLVFLVFLVFSRFFWFYWFSRGFFGFLVFYKFLGGFPVLFGFQSSYLNS